jgi:hypothetical protein
MLVYTLLHKNQILLSLSVHNSNAVYSVYLPIVCPCPFEKEKGWKMIPYDIDKDH